MSEQEEILKRVVRHPAKDDLHISRLPKKTKELFLTFAEDFCGDYGMALKYLLDFTLTFGPSVDGLQAALSEHEQRIFQLETGEEKKPVESRRTLGGRAID